MSGSSLLLMALVACAGGITFLLFRASARLAFVVWVLVLFFVPVWIGATAGFFWAAITAVTLVVLVANFADLRLTVVDAVIAVFVVIVVAMFALKLATLSATVIALLEWVLPYIWGRVVLARLTTSFVTRVIAAVATAAGVFALIEFASGSNFFVALPVSSPTLFAEWGKLQVRAGMLRAEGAWGHSIALGAAMAMSSVFVLAARWPPVVRLLSLAVIVGATVVTFSRIGLLTLALTIVLSLLFLRELPRSVRWGVTGIGIGGALAIIPFLGSVFAEAGDEASGSADYRSGLFALISQLQLFGNAGDWTGLTVGGEYLGSYSRSVDNAFLVFALRFGWVPAILLVAALVIVALAVLRKGKASPPAIAVAAQLPTLFAVALITQFGMFLWFLAGLAVAWSQSHESDADPQFDDQSGFVDASGSERFSIRRMKAISNAASRR